MKKIKKNNGIFYVVISLVAILAVCSFAVAYSMSQNVNVSGDYNYYEAEGQEAPSEISLSSFPGPEIFQRINFRAGFQSGGTNYATTSAAALSAFTLSTVEVRDDITMIEWNPGVPMTLTFMATNTVAMDMVDIPVAGDTRDYILYNASSTAAGIITLAAGTGVDVQMTEDNADLGIAGLDMARLTFIRKANSDVIVIVDEFNEAD